MMQKLKIVFMGTPDFAVPSLCALADGGMEIQAVFTQPDKPSGRKMKLQYSPVKKKALERGISVYQPLSLRKGEEAQEALAVLEQLQPDCIVVAAYGQILPKSILELPPMGCLNVHASLLPKYRGAAPIQHCILNGEKESGVTIMQMAEGLDTGDILTQRAVVIDENETASQLHDVLAQLGASLLTETLAKLTEGGITPQKQDDSLSCYASMIRKDMSALDFSRSAAELNRIVLALTGFTKLDGKRLKVLRSHPLTESGTAPAGTVVDEEKCIVQCGNGTLLQLDEVQLEGSRRMTAEEFIRGRKLEKGQQLG